MDRKTTGIIAYLTLVGWLIAFCAGDREGAKFHLNQSLVLIIANVIVNVCRYIPLIGHIVSPVLSLVLFILWIIGFVYACQDQEKEIPVLGGIRILN